MQKIIKIDDKVIVMFEDGSYCERSNVSKEEFELIVKAKSDEEVFALMCSKYSEIVQDYLDTKAIFDKISRSKLLTLEGEIVYWKEVSELSMPTELIKAVLDAEEAEELIFNFSLHLTQILYNAIWRRALICLPPKYDLTLGSIAYDLENRPIGLLCGGYVFRYGAGPARPMEKGLHPEKRRCSC